MLGVGLTRDQIARRVRQGVFERVGRGVIALPGRTWALPQRSMCAVLMVPQEALVSHWTAAQLHRLDAPHDPSTHVVVRHSRQRQPSPTSSRPAIVVHQTRALPASHRTAVDGIPTTAVERTIVDCAPLLDRWRALRMLDSASPSTGLWRRIHETAVLLSNGRAGVRFIADITGPGGDARFRSTLERRARAALRAGGVEAGEWNVAIHHDGRRIREVDLCFRAEGLIVEFDGLRFHHSRSAAQRDRRSDRELITAGWRVLRFTWEDVVYRPAQLARDVRAALDRR